MEKVNFEIASEDVKKWLDYKRIPQKKRDDLSGMIDNITSAVVEGNLTLNDDYSWTHTLVFPIENEATTSELRYKARLNDIMREPYKRVIKGTDFQSQLDVTILALTGSSVNIVRNLDSSTDKAIAESIAVFFA